MEEAPASAAVAVVGDERQRGERGLTLFFSCFYFLLHPLLCFPVTKTSFREAAVDAIELTRQSWWGEGDGWEQRDRLNRRVDEPLLLKLSIYRY